MNLELKKKMLMLDRIIKKIAPRILYLISIVPYAFLVYQFIWKNKF